MFGRKREETDGAGSPFPDWAQYARIEDAARVHLRDSALALDALGRVLAGRPVMGFVLECYPRQATALWQELTVCDGARLVVWRAEDSPEGMPVGSLVTTTRVAPLDRVSHMDHEDQYARDHTGALQFDAARVSFELTGEGPDRALRYVKTVRRDGPGQVYRLGEFARLVAALLGSPRLTSPDQPRPEPPAQPDPEVHPSEGRETHSEPTATD